MTDKDVRSRRNVGVGGDRSEHGWRGAARGQKSIAHDQRADRPHIVRDTGNVRGGDPKNAAERKKKGFDPLRYFRW